MCDVKSCDLAAAAAAATWRFEAVLCHALRGQLRQNIVQIVGVRVSMARQVGHHLSFVVDPVPHHCVRLSGGTGRTHSKNEAPHPRHLQQLQNLFLTERKGGNVRRVLFSKTNVM